ncbi:MAG: hypothetical protein L0191_10185 [Acidobacteria bacterium]|nr:hypothetical protein [Acidobacteriota bacterium]
MKTALRHLWTLWNYPVAFVAYLAIAFAVFLLWSPSSASPERTHSPGQCIWQCRQDGGCWAKNKRTLERKLFRRTDLIGAGDGWRPSGSGWVRYCYHPKAGQ